MGEMSGFTELAFSEFDILRPSIRGRYREVARKVKGWMETEGKCNRCIKYKMNTIEGTTGGNVAQLDAGYWTPAGPYIKDTLFPHVSCGMRARTINVASIEVRKRKKFSEFEFLFCSSLTLSFCKLN